MNIKQGTSIFRSEKGHKGFLYPSSDALILSSDTEARVLAWVGSSDKVAILIKEETFVHTWKEKSTIVGAAWVSKSDIERREHGV
jgi:hypothetical protein